MYVCACVRTYLRTYVRTYVRTFFCFVVSFCFFMFYVFMYDVPSFQGTQRGWATSKWNSSLRRTPITTLQWLPGHPNFVRFEHGTSYVQRIRTYVRTYIRTFLRTYIRTYVHTYVRTYVRTYIRTYLWGGGFLVRT